MGVDAGAGIEARHAGPAVELAADFECLMHFRRSLTNADGEYGAHTRFRRATEDCFAVVAIARAVEVRVRIDQQTGPPEDSGCECLKYQLVFTAISAELRGAHLRGSRQGPGHRPAEATRPATWRS